MTPARPADLPDFENPPLVETVLAVQFEPLSRMRAAHFGLFWNEIRERFPKTEEKPPLPPVIERFSDPAREPLELPLQLLGAPPTPRLWFLHSTENELLQLQADRFIKNWRKIGAGEIYPRYEKIREWFDQDFERFQAFAVREGIGPINVNQCEVTYVNHIVAGEVWSSHCEIEKVLKLWKHPEDPYPGRAEDAVVHARFPIREKAGAPVGRLHVEVQPAVRNSDGSPMFVLTLTARGMVGGGTEFFDLGREWIVRSFAAVTTEEMQRLWGRKV